MELVETTYENWKEEEGVKAVIETYLEGTILYQGRIVRGKGGTDEKEEVVVTDKFFEKEKAIERIKEIMNEVKETGKKEYYIVK